MPNQINQSVNKVQQIFDSLPDKEVQAAIREIKALDESGVLPHDGVVRTVSLRLQTEVGISAHDARHLASTQMMKQAAFRWADAKSLFGDNMPTKTDFDAAARNILGAEYYDSFVASGRNRADACCEIAQRWFVLDLQPENRERMHADLFLVQTVALNLRQRGELGLSD